jgi:hypothetical protein
MLQNRYKIKLKLALRSRNLKEPNHIVGHGAAIRICRLGVLSLCSTKIEFNTGLALGDT